MDDEDLLLTATAIYLYKFVKNKQTKKRNRKLWCRSWLQRREEGRGILHMLNSELKVEHPESYQNFLRLCAEQVDFLISLIENDLRKEDTFMRDAIPVRSKVEVTLRFLATGESFRSLMYSSRIHESTISLFIPLVCDAIIKSLAPSYLKVPTTVEEWEQVAKDYQNIWQFPHCLGALDGRHITFRPPIADGSYFFNYKGRHSIVLLGLGDANYKFLYVNIGINGRISDGGVFNASLLSKALRTNALNFPEEKCLPGRQRKVPYVIVADDAFPLFPNLLKPFPQRGLNHDQTIFNYRLSRARRMIESMFGILVNRFRVLLNPINLAADKVEKIALTYVVLHNYLCTTNSKSYTQNINEVPCTLKKALNQFGNKSSNIARATREEYKIYFNSEIGQVGWQEESINKHNL